MEPPAGGRTRIRLPAEAYRQPGSCWHVTIGVECGSPFLDAGLATAVAGLIEERCAALGAALGAYCLMPDHGHLVLSVGTTGLIDIVRDVKSRSTRLWWHHGGAGSLWQRSFHDRGLRTEQAWREAVRYVLENPQRAGLVEAWGTYPFLGGLGVVVDGDR